MMDLDNIDIEQSWNNFKRHVGTNEFYVCFFKDNIAEVSIKNQEGETQHVVYQYKQLFRIWLGLGLMKEIKKGESVFPRFRVSAQEL